MIFYLFNLCLRMLLIAVIIQPTFSGYQVVEDFSFFDNKPVVALWRGTHFLPQYFLDTASKEQYIANHGVNVPIYCAAAHRKAGVSYLEAISTERIMELDTVVHGIKATFRRLEEDDPITIDGQVFHTKRDAFQQKYTNSTDFIAKIGGKPQKKYKAILAGLPEGNPLLSFSTSVKHAAFYGYGLKNYGETHILDPCYDGFGKPANEVLGYMQGVLLTDYYAQRAMPYNVVLNHRSGYIKVKTYSSCNILAEHEISLVGMAPKRVVVISLPLKVPDFSKSYDHIVKEEFGLTKRKFNSAKTIITDAQSSVAAKEKKVADVMRAIIEGKPTNDLAYSKTLSYRFAHFFAEQFAEQGLTYVEGMIDLYGRVQQKIH